MKRLQIYLTKEVQNLYSENHTTLLKEMKENLNKWKNIQWSWIRRFNIVKMLILLSAIPIRISADFFVELTS